MTCQHTNPFTSTSFISPANPFFSLLKQNPFFQELHTVTPLTPALPFLCSPAIHQPEVPASRPRNPTCPLIAVEAGNSKAILVDGASPNLTNSFCRTDASVDSVKYTQCGDFIGDRLKLNSKIGTQKMTTLPSSYPIEPTNQTPTCGEGNPVVSNKAYALESVCIITPACTLMVDALSHSEAEANFIHCGTQKTDLNNSVPLDALESEFDSSLPHNSSIDFSELHALACPYPTRSSCTFNKDKVSAVSVCQINVTPNAMSVLSMTPKPSALSSESLNYLGLAEKFEHETGKCITFKRLTDDDTKGSVEIQKTSLPYCNFDIQETSSIVTSESPSRGCKVPESKSLTKGQQNFKLDFGIGKGDGDVVLKESAIKERTCLDVHPTTYPLGLSIPLGLSDSVLQGRLTMEKDVAGNPGCGSLDTSEVCFVGEGFDIENLKVLMDSSSTESSNMSFTKEKLGDSPHNPSKGRFGLSETLSGTYLVERPNGSRQTLSSALSPGYVLSHSHYESVDSEQYLTCMSQHSSLTISQLSPVAYLKSDTFQEAKPKSGSSQEVLTTNYQSQRIVSELQQNKAEISQETLPKNEGISQYDPSNPPLSLTFLPKSLEKCDIIEEAITGTVTNESIQKYDPPVDTMNHDLLHERIPDILDMMTTMATEECLMLDSHTFMDKDICSTESHQSHHVKCDGALEDLEIITDFGRSTENVCVCDFVSEPTSSITEDLVMTDLLLENVFVAQHAVTHSVGTSPVVPTVPRETCTNMELCPDSVKASQISKNTQATTTAASVPQGEYLGSYIHWSTIQTPLPEPSNLDRLTSGHDLLISSPLLELSPLASSTPHVAVGSNSLPLSSFPMPSAPAKSLPHTVLAAAAALPPVFAASHDYFPQEEHQVACHNNR